MSEQSKISRVHHNTESLSANHTIDISQGAMLSEQLTVTANVQISFSNNEVGHLITIAIVQDATGGRTVTWAAGKVAWVGGTAPTLTTTANAVDILHFVSGSGKVFEISRALDVK